MAYSEPRVLMSRIFFVAHAPKSIGHQTGTSSFLSAFLERTAPATVAMSLTGKPMPEFFVKMLRADGAEPERVPASSLFFGAPTVVHFYNAG
jgi:hypothetical protein